MKFRVLAIAICLSVGSSAEFVLAAEKTKNPKDITIPLLGPGTDVMSPDEYLKVYRNYIQQSMLLGYSFGETAADPCDQAIQTLFRQAGLFTYPVPLSLDKAVRLKAQFAAHSVESYMLGGSFLQVERKAKEQSLTRVLWVNSASPKAMSYLWAGAKQKGFLELQRDPRTGLERLQNIPVGYPHPYLDTSSQGLFVRILSFNGKKEGCTPTAFADNAWTHGFSLTEQRCSSLRDDLNLVWAAKLQPGDLADRERKRLRESAIQNAMARGIKKDAAEQLVDKALVPPFSHDVTIVGGAMRNLGQCNLLAIGQTLAPKAGETPKGSDSTGGAGEAK